MKQQTIYNYHPQFIFRTPLIPIQGNYSSIDLFSYTQQPFFKEAIYIASPVLHDELLKWHSGELKDKKEEEKLILSLYKYYSRMQSRCTPYGLFAACATGSWGDSSNIVTNASLKRHTRLDMNYLCALAQQLNTNAEVLPLLHFYPNNSMYVFGGALRYVEYKYVNNRRVHQITSVDNSEYLRKVIAAAQNGATIAELAALLVDDEITIDDATGFVKELISSQVIVSELEPAVTGDEFIYQVIGTLKKLNAANNNEEIAKIIQLLESTQQQIGAIDEQIGNDTQLYRAIYKDLKALNTPIEENQLFQTDLYKKPVVASLDVNIQQQLTEAIGFLNKFFPKGENGNLKKFRENFYTRYENAEVLLLEVLDTETGIGYTGKDHSGYNPLLDDLMIAGNRQQSQDMPWNRQQEILHDSLLNASKTNQYTVVFKDEDLKEMDNSSVNLPDSITVMFRVIDREKIYLQSCGGSSAANLLGRFAHGDAPILDIINDITAHEQAANSGKILAEIVHLPESRIGNILLRPALRGYEIPYLGKSALPAENQLPLQDLVVSVKNGRIILRSKKLNKEIIPRLSTAHNYSSNALPAYQFLCDLQAQSYDKSGFGFNWGAFSNAFRFLPRAEYKNVILERAKWQLPKSDFEVLLNDKNPGYAEAVTQWRAQWNMPDKVVLADHDNELYINFNDPLSVKMLAGAIKKRGRIVLEEFVFDLEQLQVKDETGAGYTNECIAVLLKNKIAEKADDKALPVATENKKIIRDFSVGSEWLYYKFYCGVKTADKLLSETIKPLAEELTAKGWINKFFFIRYSDPDLHIRLRFHTDNPDIIGKIITTVHRYVQPHQELGMITKIQMDTYTRELERYGEESMEAAESFFHTDSITTLNLLDLTDGEEGEQIRWQFALRSIDELLDTFSYDPAGKLQLLESLKEGFTMEHGGGKELKLQLDNKFRNVRKLVEDILNRSLDPEREILPLIELLDWKKEQLAPVAKTIRDLKDAERLQVPLNDLMGSYIHMMLNRIFKSRQRTFEMVIYDLLYRYYKSMLARKKVKENITIIEA